MIILYDWLTFTSKIDSPQSIIELLGLTDQPFLHLGRGLYGYHDSVLFGGIRICYDNPSYPGVMVDISGTGCRTLEEFGTCEWSVIFSMLIEDEENYHITRLDVATDDKEGILDIHQMQSDVREGLYCSRFHDVTFTESVKAGGLTIYFGSKTSEIFFRVYDKSKEREAKVGADSEELGHWVRFEISMRHDRALKFISLPYDTMGENFTGVINNYLRFIEPGFDTNKSRAQSSAWWKKFVGNLERISLYTPCDTEYSLDAARRYVYNQAGSAVHTLIKILGADLFTQELEENRPKKFASKYKALIAENLAKLKEEMGEWSDYEIIFDPEDYFNSLSCGTADS